MTAASKDSFSYSPANSHLWNLGASWMGLSIKESKLTPRLARLSGKLNDSLRNLFSESGMILPSTLPRIPKSEEHTSELQSLMRISYDVFCLKKKKNKTTISIHNQTQITL